MAISYVVVSVGVSENRQLISSHMCFVRVQHPAARVVVVLLGLVNHYDDHHGGHRDGHMGVYSVC